MPQQVLEFPYRVRKVSNYFLSQVVKDILDHLGEVQIVTFHCLEKSSIHQVICYSWRLADDSVTKRKLRHFQPT